MIASKVRELFHKFRADKEAKVKSIRKKKLLRKTTSVVLPDNVLSKIFDYSSPMDVAKWRSVNRQFNRVAVERDQAILYLDVLRLDIYSIIPKGSSSDGDFFKHSSAQILAHSEKRSILLAAHSHWTPYDADKILKAIRYFGRYARTVSLDASIAELCVAGQCSNDITYWFQFQTVAGTADPSSPSPDKIPGWLPTANRHLDAMQIEAELPRWNPKTECIPFGPIFPRATEISVRASRPQLRRLRRFCVYGTSATNVFNRECLELFRVIITGSRTPCALKLKSFLDWLDSAGLAGKFCAQFC